MTQKQKQAMENLCAALHTLHPQENVWRTPTDEEAVTILRAIGSAQEVLCDVDAAIAQEKK